MAVPLDLLDLLSDGRFHSGAVLGGALGITGTTVWKRINSLREMGLDIHAVRGRGYRLSTRVQRLDAEAIRAALPESLRHGAFTLSVLPQVDSTSSWLAAHAPGAANGSACLAEQQIAGRGRGGRIWVSPFGRNVYLSMLWRMPARAVSGLSIAVGVCVAEACEALGASAVALKWPNDLLCFRDGEYKKLGGILVDVSSDGGDGGEVIIGIGLNVDMPAVLRAGIEQAVCDMNELIGARVSRNELAAKVMEGVMLAMPRFELEGLVPFRARFLSRDVNLDREVQVRQGHSVSTGVARGIDEGGALLVETSQGLMRFYSGDVSVRATT